MLIAFAAHGVFYPVRLVGKKGGHWVFGLLKKAVEDSIERGMHFYVVHLDFDKERIEYRLAKLAVRRGAVVQPGGWIGGQLKQLLVKNWPKPAEYPAGCREATEVTRSDAHGAN